MERDPGLKNFRLLDSRVDIRSMLEEVERCPELWNYDKSRQQLHDIHGQTHTIVLRSHTHPASADKAYRECVPGCYIYVGRRTKVAESFPSVCAFVNAFALRAIGVLGRVAIVSLRGGGCVRRHVDDGMYYKLRCRYHLVLQSPAGSRMTSGNEQVTMQAGEFWWLNNRQEHEAFNDSDRDRVHVIIDLMSPATLVGAVSRSIRFRSRQLLGTIRTAASLRRVT